MSDFNPGGSRWPSDGTAPTDLLAWYARSGDHFLRYEFARSFCRSGSVVEIGCGHGFGALALDGVVRSYVGLDIDVDAIGWARKQIQTHLPRAEFHSIERLDDALNWEGCDVAIAFEVLEHLKQPEELLKVLWSVVREGGICLLSTPNGSNSKGDPALFVSPYHVREYRFDQLKTMLEGWRGERSFFMEYRIDGADLIGRRALGRPLGRNLSPEPASIRQKFLRWLNTLWNTRLNGPKMWRIRPFDEISGPRRPYSTTLVALQPRRAVG